MTYEHEGAPQPSLNASSINRFQSVMMADVTTRPMSCARNVAFAERIVIPAVKAVASLPNPNL